MRELSFQYLNLALILKVERKFTGAFFTFLEWLKAEKKRKKHKPTDLKHIYKQSYSDAPHLTTVFTGSAHNVSDRCRQYRHGLGGKYRTHANVGFIMKEISMSCQGKLPKFRATRTVWTPQRKEEMKVMQWYRITPSPPPVVLVLQSKDKPLLLCPSPQ